MTKQEKELEKIVAPVVQDTGYTLYDIEFVKEGKEYFLRIYIDNENGIDLDDCEKVSNAVGEELDKLDPISIAYSLEVSSCGLERRLRERKHFEAAISKNIEVRVFKAINNEKVIIGDLTKISEDEIVVNTEENGEVKVSFDNISNAKILYNWEELKNE